MKEEWECLFEAIAEFSSSKTNFLTDKMFKECVLSFE